jgi:hypothetical protein
MKGTYDQNHHELEFQEGDWVWLCLHHCIAATLTNKDQGKQAPKFYGSFLVVARVGSVAYKLPLPPTPCMLLCLSFLLLIMVGCYLSQRRSNTPVSTVTRGKF